MYLPFAIDFCTSNTRLLLLPDEQLDNPKPLQNSCILALSCDDNPLNFLESNEELQ